MKLVKYDGTKLQFDYAKAYARGRFCFLDRLYSSKHISHANQPISIETEFVDIFHQKQKFELNKM